MRRFLFCLFTNLLLVFLLPACDDSSSEPETSIPEYKGLDTSNLPASKLLNVPLRGGYGPFCYIQSLSMMLAYLNPSITSADVFAYSGYGATLCYSSYGPSFNPSAPGEWVSYHHKQALQNFNTYFVIGSGADCYGDLLETASGILTIGSANEALTFLKAAISSGRPVVLPPAKTHLRLLSCTRICQRTSQAISTRMRMPIFRLLTGTKLALSSGCLVII